MPLFHPHTIKNALKLFPTEWEKHKVILENWAKNLSEGRYNEEKETAPVFVETIMQNFLGYKNSSAVGEFTLAHEQSVDARKVDLKLGKFGNENQEVVAVFELKGAKTKDLDAEMAVRGKSPVEQAWKYATKQPNVKWVMVSNFKEIEIFA